MSSEMVAVTPGLLPCPFCGGDAHWSPTFVDSDTPGTVQCANGCGATVICDGDKATRIAAWNTRQQAEARATSGAGEISPDVRAHLIFGGWTDKDPDAPDYWFRLPSWVQDYATECVRAASTTEAPGSEGAGWIERLRESLTECVAVLERLPYGDWPGRMYSGKVAAANRLIRRARLALNEQERG